MANPISRRFYALMAASLLSLPTIGYANPVNETPSALAMTGDILVARPLLFATTLAGSAVFLVASPLSALGGNLKESGEILVLKPAEATFIRCLGCTIPGRKSSDVVEQEN